MEIVCARCGKPYAIDDGQVAGRAARAQCPGCRHVQAVGPAQGTGALLSATEKLKCQSCGKALADAFDEAIGTCAACRAKEDREQKPLEIAGTPTPARAAAILAAAAEAEASGALHPPTMGGRTPLPSTRTPLPIAPLPEQRPLTAERKRSPVVALLLAGVLLGGVAAGGFVLYQRRAEQQRLAALPPPLPPAVEQALGEWRKAHGESPGNPLELLQAARKEMARDTPDGYLAAERAYQKAAVVDPYNDEALIGYVQAVALGHPRALDDQTYGRVRAIADAVLARSKGAPAAELALANLLLARPNLEGNVDQARALAQRVSEKGPPSLKADALVVIGRCFSGTSAALAVQSFEQALALAPENLAAVYHRGLARAASGELHAAIADLQARLAKDPKHPLALAAVARIYQEVGEVGAARRVLEKAVEADPGAIEPVLQLAIHRYQLEGRAGDAAAALRALTRKAGVEPRQLLAVWSHLAAAERLQGNRDAAARATAAALELSVEHPPAQLQALLLALDRRDAAAATAALEGLKGRSGDPGLEGVLAGKVALLDGRPQDAIPAFLGAAGADPRRLDASLLSAVILARSKKRADAIGQVFVAVNGDPARAAPRALPTELFVRENELLRGHEGELQRLAENADDPMPLVIEGVYRFLLGDHQDADVLFQRATHLDAASSVSYGYRALIALERGERGQARQLGERAAFHGKQIAIARYANGAAKLATGADPEETRSELRAAQELAPSWPSIELRLAELDQRLGKLDSARARLQRAVGIDPTFLEAKALLFELEKEE